MLIHQGTVNPFTLEARIINFQLSFDQLIGLVSKLTLVLPCGV